MIKTACFILLFVGFLLTFIQAQPKDSISIASYNIRLETPADTGARAWKNRKSDLAKIFKQNKFDIVGVQEIGSNKQKNDLMKLLPSFTYYGKGRDNQQQTAGEQIGIIFKSKRFKLKQHGSFFLSETPEILSKGWDADFRRLCVWARFYDLQSKYEFYVFNSHFDHVGKKARTESAKLIVSRIKLIEPKIPVFFVGDLNSSPFDTLMYQRLTDLLTDTAISSQKLTVTTQGTFNGYDMNTENFSANQKIDYIFYRNANALEYKVINSRFNNLSYPSDHFPVVCYFEFISPNKD